MKRESIQKDWDEKKGTGRNGGQATRHRNSKEGAGREIWQKDSRKNTPLNIGTQLKQEGKIRNGVKSLHKRAYDKQVSTYKGSGKKVIVWEDVDV